MDTEDADDAETIGNTGSSATVVCVQYLISHHLKNKKAIKRDELLKDLKGRITGKNFDLVMEDVSNTLNNVFGLYLSFINNKLFIIVNNLEEIYHPEIAYNHLPLYKYRILLKPIVCALIMHRKPISEGQMWNNLGKFADEFNLDMDILKKVVKEDFVQDLYLTYKETDETTAIFDPQRTSYWFSLGPRALTECDQFMALQRVSELFKRPPVMFLRVYADLYKTDD